jgi:DNA-directed RNA polymerase subunit alpha
MVREEVTGSTQTLEWKCVESRVDSKRLYYGRFILFRLEKVKRILSVLPCEELYLDWRNRRNMYHTRKILERATRIFNNSRY